MMWHFLKTYSKKPVFTQYHRKVYKVILLFVKVYKNNAYYKNIL